MDIEANLRHVGEAVTPDPSPTPQVEPVRCPNCGGEHHQHWAWAEDVEYRTTQDVYEYRRCSGCGVVFLVDPPLDDLGVIYPADYYSFSGGDPSALERVKGVLDRRLLGRELGRLAGARLSVLDVGGGVGFMADATRRADPRVVRSVVVDLDDGCRAVAEEHGHEFVRSRIEDYDPGDERFDLILAFNLIEHVADPRAVLRALAGVLAPGGRLVIKTPNVDAWDARLFRTRSWGGLHCPRHWVLFDEPSFREAADASGLRVEKFAYTQGAPFWAVNLAHELEVRGWWSRPPGVPIGRTAPYRAALAAAAAFDTFRRPVARTSQMFVVLTPSAP